MAAKVRLCQICLRADRILAVIDDRLSDFHDELCDYTLLTDHLLYCEECAYLLKKMYNFRSKCMKACQIYRKWVKTKPANKKSPYILYTLLPPIPLSIWLPNTSKVYEYSHDEDTDDTFKELSTHINVGGEGGTGNAMDGVETLSHRVKDIKSDICLLQDRTDVTEEDGANFQPHIVVLHKERNTQLVECNQELNEKINQNVKIKIELDPETDSNYLQLQNVLKVEDRTNFHEVPLMNESNSLDGEADVKQQRIDHSLDDAISNNSKNVKRTTKKTAEAKALKQNISMSSDESHSDIDDFPDDSNDDSEEDVKLNPVTKTSQNNDTKAEISKKKAMKKSLDDISSQDAGSSPISSKRKRSISSTIVVKLEMDHGIVDKDAEGAAKDIVKDENDGEKKQTEKKKKIIMKKTKLDNDSEIMLKKIMRETKNCNGGFVKERLISQLKLIFESCGEITTDDGVSIDKEFIIESIEDRVTEFLMNRLWKAVRNTRIIKPRALKIFDWIQKNYKHDYDSIFDIEYLNTKEKILKEFQDRKNYECYVNAEFKCEICFLGFKHEKKLEYHSKIHLDNVSDHVCSVCGVRLTNKKYLNAHVKNCHEAVYKCKLCPLVTYYKYSMVNHHLLHKGVKFTCEQCSAVFKSKSTYHTHLSSAHEKNHLCTTCGRAFATEKGVRWHFTREHQGAAPDVTIRCVKCSSTFPSLEALTKHVAAAHPTRPRGRRPGTIVTIKKRPVLTCKVCKSVGHSVGWLDLHYRMEHPSVEMDKVQYADRKTHLCDVCGKGFTTIYGLKYHLSKHTDACPYACSLCPKRFRRALSLQQHKLFHLPPSKSCTYCNKKFRTQSNLYNHIRIHIGDRRYKCELCDKGFLHRTALNEHVRGVHLNKRRVRKRALEAPETTLTSGSG